MMDNFSQILLRMPTVVDAPSTRSHFRGVTPFKVQVNFEIPLFEVNIYADSLEKWLSLLQGYFSVQKNFNIKNITFTLLKSLPHVKDWWDGYCKRHEKEDTKIFET